ncbi:Rne/Rng family ribonuclease [Desulforhopalus sp. IMCC35007]|uniref:Rne/Rng family ribonuclease n=1 Tax=Desulforhopalus sp. IMCC35007 TaxID=2569543 RepID=UPI0010AE121C|nr:Rne/Rng family ribonuclease [Desulforhopalus sp. IMCC35007]TKB10072.1 Rne/Rng family ribonuclease [Desulforhopalus sp. IMCC35007]
MAERKKTEKETKTVQIKATTGAWWKSKSAEEKVDASAPLEETSKEVKPKRRRRPKKEVVTETNEVMTEKKEVVAEETVSKTPPAKAPRSRARKKKVAVETVEVTESSAQANVETATEEPPVTPTPQKRKTKPRAPRGKRKPAEKVAQAEIESNNAAVADSVQAVKSEAVAESSPVKAGEEPVKPRSTKPRRGRRPRTSAKKTTPVADNEERSALEKTPVDSQDEDELTDIDFVETTDDLDEATVEEERRHPRHRDDEEEDEEEQKEEVKKNCKLLINAEEPEECRLALLEDGRLISLNVSTISRAQRKNNIYKARIVAIEPSLQAAFVEYGTEKNGFLPFSEIHPEYFKQDLSADVQHLVDTQQWKKLSITDVVEKGQDILAQVVKEEVGKKGANMTTFLSIPGRCVVLMPGSDSSGISRKISGEQRRSQLREIMKSMDLPEGIGWIVRTSSVDITPEDLSRDVGYLVKLWEEIKGRGQNLEGVGLVYEEQHSILRFLREHFDPSIQEILVDDRAALEQVKDFVQMLPKDHQGVTVRLHQGARPIFNQYSVEDQIESIYQPQVSLPSGGSIVIDPTEALVAIDVNSGSTSKGKNFEASIFQANMEAAVELARQLRLRDLGGLIVVDFIDMRSRKNIIAVEKQVRAAMKKDKAKVDFSRISKFGLMEISRQKLGAPIEAGNYRRCEHCKGRGTVRSVETLSLFYLRRIQTGASRKPVERIECHFPLDVAAYLLNKKRTEVSEMEKRYHVEITIHADPHMKPSDNEIVFHKAEKDTNNKKQA